jgi:LEA14-like dessication related protein
MVSAAFVLSACGTLEGMVRTPEIAITAVEFAGIDFGGVDLVAKVSIENPAPVSIPFPEIGWDFLVEKKSFLQGTINNDKALAASSSTVVDVPFRVGYEGLFDVFKTIAESDEIPCTLALDAAFSLPVLGERVFHAEIDRSIPVVKIPSLSFRGISLKSLTLTKVECTLDWEIENKNTFALSVDTFSYTLKVNGASWSEGGIEAPPEITAKSTVRLPLTISLNSLAMIRDITTLVSSGAAAAYDCTGNFGVSGGLPGLKGIEIPFSFTGNSRLRN